MGTQSRAAGKLRIFAPGLRKRAVPSKNLSELRRPQAFQEGDNDLGDGSHVTFFPQAFSGLGAQLMQALEAEVPWQQKEITVMGRKVMQPRLVAYMADDPSLGYTYSKTKQNALPWTSTVLTIKKKIEELSGTQFNSCLLNLYRDGKDSLSWHSDNEKPYGSTPTIGSVSFGGSRDFQLRNNYDRSMRYSVSLGGDGDVLLMSGTCQKHYQHCIPKRSNVNQPRANLTFRNIIHKEALQ